MANALSGKHILVTGGAGFIGSNLVEYLLNNGSLVRVLDNFETGRMSNVEKFLSHRNFSLIEGDIRNYADCSKAVKNVNAISHQAALGSVPRSVAHPLNTHAVNATGFMNMLQAAKEEGVKRFVFASSSSVYGDSLSSPKVVGEEGDLLSPYAVTKQLNEDYAKVFVKLFGMETIGLRYFNVFGTNQDPAGEYAAAIPKFIDKMIRGEQIVIHGDGNQTRDFTFVANAVKANVLALGLKNDAAFGQAFNVACNESFSLNSVVDLLKTQLTVKGLYNANCSIQHGPVRIGDINHSLADISETRKILGYTNLTPFNTGIQQVVNDLYVQRTTKQ